MNCRLCNKDITKKDRFLLYDFDENLETRLGRKINTILNSSENKTLSNYCCKCCSCKIKICFSLLVEIKASDEVIQQTYENSWHKNNIDLSTQTFNCVECNACVSGIKSFIKHHENHIWKKTIAGTKKDVLSSFSYEMPKKKILNKIDNPKSAFSNDSLKRNDELNFDIQNDDMENIDSIEENDNFEGSSSNLLNYNFEKLNKSYKTNENLDFIETFSDEESEDFFYDGDDDDDDDDNDDEDDDIDDYDGDDDDDNYNSFDNIKDNYDENDVIEYSNAFNDDDEDCENDVSDVNYGGEEISLKNFDSLLNESDFYDTQSEDSFKSDLSYKNLVEITLNELQKSDTEDESANSVKLKPNENGEYCCEVCDITFKYKFILLLHLQRNHTAFHEYDVALEEKHFETFENNNEFFLKCCYCKSAFRSADFKSHILNCKEHYSHSKSILCQVCGEMCNIRNLEKHMKQHKKMDGWECELCGKKFKSKRFLKSHLGEHDESKKKICEICGKKLLPLSFFSHITKHREKRHICQYCGKAFTYNYGLKIHLKVHDANKKLESKPEKKKDRVFCWLCKKDFNCTSALNKHLKNDHNAEGVEQDSRFPCSQCDKKFADMFSLKAHLKLIHELKDEEIARLKSLPVYRYIECNVCKKVFNSENKIRIHMKQDHGLKPFEMEILKKECEKCGKKFASKQNLIHHINGAHLHIKPMTCDICQEKFAKHSSLIYHKLRHSGEKPFQCEFCHKSYRQRNDVIRHLARHVRDKELTLEEASAVNNSPSRLVIKRRIFLKDSSINYRTIVRKNRRKSEAIEMEPILEEEVNDIQEEQMEFSEDGISNMIYVEEVPIDENQPESPSDIHCMNAKPVYNEERNTIILSSPDNLLNTVKCKYIPAQLKHIPAVIVKKQEQF